jgi:uncharacterized protein YcaQ
LDNLLWDRKFIKALFGFDYRWEVYKPVAERQYGYYVLPILYGDRFVARFEPGFDKKSRKLTIKNWWWEPEVNPSETALIECFQAFKAYLHAQKIVPERKIKKRADLSWLQEI